MLRSVKEIKGYVLQALDSEVGRCKDFLFDDDYWTIRYMVADTGKWLPGRSVLISPISLDEPNWSSGRFPVRLSKQQIEGAPGFDEDKPVSRQYEVEYFRYYDWPYYWGGAAAWGVMAAPGPLFNQEKADDKPAKNDSGDKHLRSIDEVTGYHTQATDGEIGHVEDFILDDETWTIRYLVVDTRNWLPGKEVLLSPEWIQSIDWADRKVTVDQFRQEVKDSPTYDPSMPVNSEFEERLYDFYGRPKYWVS
jgi:hypothetical protein